MRPRIAVLSVIDVVAADLRSRLFSGELTGGHSLTEAQVAKDYDIARPTAKAAIEQLVAEGLLQRSANKTARVPVLGADAVRDIYRTRAHLEGEALRLLAAERLVPDAARQANLAVLSVADKPSLHVVEPDMQFHTALISAVNSPRLSQMYQSLVQEVKLCMAQVQGRNLLTVESIASEHQRILEHVAAGDADAAAALLHAHLARASEQLVEAIGRTPAPEGSDRQAVEAGQGAPW